jgi:translocation and assembly module TamB
MGITSRKRKFFVLLGLAAAVLVILLVSAPLWFPWILPSILKAYGVKYSGYERDGYTRIVLRDVKWARDETVFHAKRLEVLFPTTFLVRNFRDDRREDYLRVSDWSLKLAGVREKNSAGTKSVLQTAKKIDATFEQLNRWIPKASLNNGKIQVAEREFLLPVTEWASGNLTGRVSSEKILPETYFHAQLGSQWPRSILIENPAWDLGGELRLSREKHQRLKVEGGVLWQSNRVDLAARFGPKSWLPEIASIKSESFRIPAEIIKLEGYSDLAGALDVQWRTNSFALDITANAQPRRGEEIYLSPVNAAIHASGDTNSVRIETAKISSPWLSASLSKNAEFNFRGELLSSAATLNLSADLTGQHWINATGRLNGDAILRRGKNRFPDTSFTLAGAQIGVDQVNLDSIDLRGELNWPWLRIPTARVEFKQGATAQAELNFNAVTREVADGKLRFDGTLGRQFLPANISYRDISLAADFSGPLKNLSHAGHLELRGLEVPQAAPLEIVTEWHAQKLNFTALQATLSAKNTALSFGGTANFETNKVQARIDKLILRKSDAEILTLEKPFAFRSEKKLKTPGWLVSIEPFRWSGKETEIRLQGDFQWPEKGNFSVAARQLAFVRFANFFEKPLPEVFVETLDASGDWTNGPAKFAVSGLARFFSKSGTAFSLELRGDGNEKGISVHRAKVGTMAESIISGQGFLPLAIVPSNGSNFVQVLPKQKIDFHAETVPNTEFWESIEDWLQTGFRDPRGTLSISGTLDAPEGKLTASAKEILLKPKEPNEPMPRLQNLFADFDLARQRIQLNRAEVFVEGQPVTASGELPLPEKLTGNWKKIFDWRKIHAQLKIVDAQIAPFERLFPKFLSPLGTVNLDLAMSGGKLDGELRVANAALRPIPSLGPVHDIEARVKFLDERVTLEKFQGTIGGQPVSLFGEINLAKRETNGLPDFAFHLHGTNVPLARSPDLILRSDMDLALVNTNAGEPLVSGKLTLRDSFFLSDLKLLIPGKIAKPKQRPPYFSVEVEPFAGWRLNVAVRGTNFLKVRSPVFRGELSANLKLEGTLKEPVALGDLKINSGIVQFPFANLRVGQGFVSLTSENPYRPQLAVTASARTYGYDVKMDVSGFANQPVIEFSSNPGLTSEQILLMVTAGELPRDELNFSTQQRAGRLAFFLGKNLMSKFGATGAQDDKLEIRSGENISEQGRQTYYLEYKLSDEWSIVGEYDRFGGLNAGFKWKFFEK